MTAFGVPAGALMCRARVPTNAFVLSTVTMAPLAVTLHAAVNSAGVPYDSKPSHSNEPDGQTPVLVSSPPVSIAAASVAVASPAASPGRGGGCCCPPLPPLPLAAPPEPLAPPLPAPPLPPAGAAPPAAHA